MDPLTISAGIGAISSGLGGWLNSNATSSANRNNLLLAQQQMEAQERFAKQGIRWRVNDAQKAGIHPLFALGANTASYAPVSVQQQADHSMGNAVANMGQDIGRAIHASSTEQEQLRAYNKTVQDLGLTRMGLENELLASQIAKLRQPGTGPGLPGSDSERLIPGQKSSGFAPGAGPHKVVPLEQVASAPGRPDVEAGAVTSTGHVRFNNGSYGIVRSKDAAERMEDDAISTIIWNMQNRIGGGGPPPEKPQPGNRWVWSVLTQQWKQEPVRDYRPRYKSRVTTGGGFGGEGFSTGGGFGRDSSPGYRPSRGGF